MLVRHATILMLLTTLWSGCTVPAVPRTDPVRSVPAALVDGRPISWRQLQPALAELAGSQVLEEAVMDDLLLLRCAEMHLSVTPELIQQERDLLVASLDADPNRAESLLAAIRASRRLGDARFLAALRRSAMLRALVGPPRPPESLYVSALKARTDPSAKVRVIVCRSESDASSVRAALGQPPIDVMRFAALAAERSEDESAARGGLIEPVRKDDTLLPAALRDAVWEAAPGTLTPVIATGSGFILAFVEQHVSPEDAALAENQRQALAEQTVREVNARWQRIEMERIARELLSAAKVVPMDRSLGWSWEQRGK